MMRFKKAGPCIPRKSKNLPIFFIFMLISPVLKPEDCPVLENIILSVINDTNVIMKKEE
jgi:hypothetical protein